MVGSKSSMGLPEGSSSRICLPPTPVTMSFRNCAPAFRNLATVAARSVTSRVKRFQPPGSGTRPSGHGLRASAGTARLTTGAEQEAKVAPGEHGEGRGRMHLLDETEMLAI